MSSLVQSPFVIAVAPPPFPVSPACTDALISLAGAFADMQIFPFPPFFASPLTPPPRVGPRRSLIGRNREPTIVISPSPPPPQPHPPPCRSRVLHCVLSRTATAMHSRNCIVINPLPLRPRAPPCPTPSCCCLFSGAASAETLGGPLADAAVVLLCVCVCLIFLGFRFFLLRGAQSLQSLKKNG